jgi:hypothetical protein
MKKLCALAVLVGVTSCYSGTVERIPAPPQARADNKLSVSGNFCTTDPDDLLFPVKILFAIDTSQSMGVTDPNLTRLDAVLQVIDATLNTPGVEIAIEIFGASTAVVTTHCDDYVTRANCVTGFAPPDQALAAAGQVAQQGGTTDFTLAMQTVVGTLASDMALSDPKALQQSRYVVIFLSDGIPDTDSTFNVNELCGNPPVDPNSEAAEWANTGKPPADPVQVLGDMDLLIGEMRDLARQFDVRELSVNTAFTAAADTDTFIKTCGANMMRGMAKAGNGTFRDFSSGEAINFLFVDFTSFKRVFAMKNFTASNINARPFSAALGVGVRVDSDDPTLAKGIVDSDGDGLADEVENLIGTDPFLQDTDNDGFSDLLEHSLSQSGFDPLDPTDADCKGDNDRFDDDGDGLRNCEEIFFGTNSRLYDSDNDGFGDGIEVLYGSNPGLPDTLLDIDFDGVGNAAEMRAHSRVDRDDVSDLSENAYIYKVRETGIEGSTICYDFNVKNIALATTLGAQKLPDAPNGTTPAAGLGGGDMLPSENRILFEVTESPFDSPSERGISRVACARARFDADKRLKEPANGEMILPREAFKPADEFNPAVDCVDP